MSVMDGVVDAADSLFAWLSGATKQNAYDYCCLETAEDSHTLVAKDGSLLTVMRVDGVSAVIGNAEFTDLVDGLTLSIQSYFGEDSAHMIQVYMANDPNLAHESISLAQAPSRLTAKTIGLSLDDLFEERERHLAKFVSYEGIFFVLWTRPAALSRQEASLSRAAKKEWMKKHRPPLAMDAQNLVAGITEIRNRHRSFVRAMEADMRRLHIVCETLEVHAAIREVRRSVDPEFTEPDWSGYLPGDKIPLRDSGYLDRESDISEVMWPPIPWQVFPRDAEIINLTTVRVGDRIYAPLYVDLPPKEVAPFIDLFAKTLTIDAPWRISFLIEGGALRAFSFKKMMADLLSFSGENRLVSDALEELREMEVEGESMVKVSISLATWAGRDDIKLLRERASRLARAAVSWGHCDIREVSGDSLEGMLSSSLSISYGSVGTPAAAPLRDVIKMLPITRPASPWATGSMLMRSPDGKLMPYQPGSSKQTTWNTLVAGRPGSGKSVLMAASNLAICLAPGIQRLPRIAIIDIGPSSSGFISLLRDALPENRRHEVAHFRMKMAPDYAINPFDTQMGSRFPTSQDRAFLVNFITLLATPAELDTAYDSMTSLVSQVVDEVYKMRADTDRGRPYAYSIGVDTQVDTALDLYSFETIRSTTWWDVVDFLFEKKEYHVAMLAQRHAVPSVADMGAAAMSEQVRTRYSAAKVSTQESLPEAFSRLISDAVRDYPVLSSATKFDIGDARVVAIDLDEVAKKGGSAADRQSAVMYMLARYALARNFSLNLDNLPEFPDRYQAYHRERIKEINEDLKRICYDEFHRTKNSRSVREQVLLDQREGRKWNVDVMLGSQSIEDFDDDMISFATAVFIMDAGQEQTVNQVQQRLGLTPAERGALVNYVHGPSKSGATMLARFDTKNGRCGLLLTSTLGPIEIWAYSTTAEDASLRRTLSDVIGPSNARKLLAKHFPGGTAKDEVERRKNLAAIKGKFSDEIDEGGIINALAKELLESHLTK